MDKHRKLSFSEFYVKYGTLFIFIVIFVIAAILNNRFLTVNNITNILRQNTVYAILAFGATFVIILGHINVSYGTVAALAGCVAAMVARNTGSMTLAVLAAVAVGLTAGVINGFFVTKFQVPAFIVTLAMQSMAQGFVFLFTNAKPITGLPDTFKIAGQGTIGFIPVPVIIMILFFGFSWVLLNKTKYGRYVYAVGGNINAAQVSGIRTKNIVRLAFIFDGILTGIAGVILMSRINSGYPSAGEGYEFDAITAVVVGGTSLSGGIGTMTGTFVGALIVGIINNILNLMNVNTYWQYAVRGFIILIAVVADILSKGINKRNN